MSYLQDTVDALCATLEASGPSAVWPTNEVDNKRPVRIETPTTDLGYGSDLSCIEDVTEAMAELEGDDIGLVVQANYRRLRTPRGALLDDPDYGYDLALLLHAGMTRTEIQGVADQIRAELEKDDRNDSVDVTLRQVTAREWVVFVTGQTSTEPWDLTLAVTDGAALLRAVNSGGIG